MIRQIAAVTSLLLVSASTLNAAVYNYFDTTFNNADWNGVIYADTSVPPAVFAANQINGGGSNLLPGPQTPDYRNIRHTYGGPGAGAIVVTHQGANYSWSPLPLETALTVDYTYDLNFIDGPTGAVGFAPAIFQGVDVYRSAPYDDAFGPFTGWNRFSGSGLPIASFQRIDPVTGGLLLGSPNPTMAMDFGFVSANSANATATKISGIDDFGINLNTLNIPEPTMLAVLAAPALLLVRRRRI